MSTSSDLGLSFEHQDMLDNGFMIFLACMSSIGLIGAIVSFHYGWISKIIRNILMISALFQLLHFVIYTMTRHCESTLLDFFGPMVNGALVLATIVLVNVYPSSPIITTFLGVQLAIIVGFVIFRLYGSVIPIGKMGKIQVFDHTKYSAPKRGSATAVGPIGPVAPGRPSSTPVAPGRPSPSVRTKSTDTAQGVQGSATAPSVRTKSTGFIAIRASNDFWITLIIIIIVVSSLLTMVLLAARTFVRQRGRLTDHPELLDTLVAFMFLSVLLLCYYLILFFGDSGYLLFDRSLVRKGDTQTNMWSYCDRCSTFRPPRTIHCTECKLCVPGYDHHCPWLNKCIGKNNLCFFQLFCLLLISWLILVIVESAILFIHAAKRTTA